MPIPDYESIMLPLLKFSADQKEHSLREAIDSIAKYFKLSAEEKEKLFPSGNDIIFNNRVRWARFYLAKAGLLEYIKRGIFKITQQGLNVLNKNPSEINVKFLEQFPEFVKFRETSRKEKAEEETIESKTIFTQTPKDTIEYAYQKIRQELAEELLMRVKDCSPIFFERLVIKLLVNMGYGGSIKDAGETTKRTSDGGIDGIIKEDKLGLDTIFIQAKRWEGTVGRPEIQKFVGALQGQRAKKGIFITTSEFSGEARDYVSNIESKIILIDGEKLTQLMIDNDIGVSKEQAYEIKKTDEDYFTEE